MAAAPAKKKAASNFPVVFLPDIPYRKVDVVVKLKKDPKKEEEPRFEVNDQCFIMNMNVQSSSTRELIIGDKVLKINGKPVKGKGEILPALNDKSDNKELKLELSRRQFTSPLSGERQKKIGVLRMEGFTYFVLTCANEGKDISASFGFTLKMVKNKAHVMAIEPRSIASKYFCVGDALLDLDGVAIPFDDMEFLKQYAMKYFKQGKFTAAIERPAQPETFKLYNRLFMLLQPQESDVDMGPDAVNIGKEASAMHRMVFRKLKPRSVLTRDKNLGNVKATTVAAEFTSDDVGIKIANKSLETRIGSDVEDEDDLKPVERKSHSASDFDDF